MWFNCFALMYVGFLCFGIMVSLVVLLGILSDIGKYLSAGMKVAKRGPSGRAIAERVPAERVPAERKERGKVTPWKDLTDVERVSKVRQNFRIGDDGLLYWSFPFGRRRSGPINTVDNCGYVRVLFRGKFLRVHHVVWMLSTGCVPDKTKVIDHIDRVRTNNRIDNLREVTASENQLNSSRQNKT